MLPFFRIFWFGLTQKQEARWGFDACMRLGARLVVFQLKASDWVLTSGARRFKAQHHQLVALQKLTAKGTRSVFYVFPDVGNTSQLRRSHSLLSKCQLADIATFPNPFPHPTTRHGHLRKNACHYVDVTTGAAIFHSDPVTIDLQPADFYFGDPPSIDSNATQRSAFMVKRIVADPTINGVPFESRAQFNRFWEFAQHLGRSSVAAGFIRAGQ